SSSNRYIFPLTALGMLVLVAGLAAQSQPAKEPPPKLPPGSLPVGEWNANYVVLDKVGKETTIKGGPGVPAELEDDRMLFRADVIVYDQDTGVVKANGHVYYRNFLKNEQIWASRLEYNTESQDGVFYEVRGEMRPRLVTRPGVLSVDSPFHFEGRWATRAGERYTLYDGWVTNCKLPKPWWRLRGPKFIITPEESALAYKSVFILRKVPIFYLPFFYHSLAKEPRKSGFLFPNFQPRSQRGFMVGLGYYWAINRSYDATYYFQDFTSNAFTHHVDLRGKPRVGTDFDAILYGVQDRGMPGSGPNPPTYSGVSIYVVGKSDLGNGWTVRGYANYISSFRFRQQWSQSYAEVIGSEIHSVGTLNKNWSDYSFDLTFARLQNFQSTEVPFTDPVTGKNSLLPNAVTIRKLPEAEVVGRDRQLFKNVPLWLSFDSTAGLLFRSQPIFDANNTLVDQFATSQFTDRVNVAPHLTTALHFGDFHLVPSIGFQETFYSEAQGPNPANPGFTRAVGTNIVRSARDFSLDLVFPSLARVYNKKTIFGDKLKHVIEPRVTYKYMTGIGTDFDRFVRFDEADLLTNTNELALSITNRIYAKRGDSVQEIFTWELMQKRYFDPTFGGALVPGVRNVFAASADLSAYAFLAGPRSSSPIDSLLRASPIAGLGIQWQADYDPLYHAIVDSGYSVDYHWKKYNVLVGNNEVHNYIPQTPLANQFHFHAGLGDANRRGLNAGFDAVYDYRAGVVEYYTTQVTYNTDCCGISVQVRRYNIGQRDESVWRIAFAIGNVGTLGTLRKQDRLF
ncbi:MAG TPA: LPS assembly protein LptD, partial [Bryobacteraceae bacterium]